MTEIKRYDCDVYYDRGMYEHSNGGFVSYEDHAAIVAALQEQLSSHSMSAGQADQRKAESDAVRVAMGFSADADDVAPCDLVDAIGALQEQVRELATENSIQDFIISAVKDLVRESEGVAGWHPNGDIASWDKALPELNHSETPATDAALREIRAQARAEGIHFAANRLLAAWESGFVDDTPAAAHDISGAILSAVEFLPNAFEAEFKRDYADEVRARIRAGEQP